MEKDKVIAHIDDNAEAAECFVGRESQVLVYFRAFRDGLDSAVIVERDRQFDLGGEGG